MNNDSSNAKDLNRSQFGANASNYADSAVHAKGASLAAFAFAPHVAHVTASDLTPEMVALTAERAGELGHDNVTTQLADAEALPFEDDRFELVTCRIAPHHFPDPGAFITEVSRVLTSGGTFAMVDNVVPNDAEVALFCDDWERRRDPSHVGCLSMDEWSALMTNAGMVVQVSETAPKRMGFQFWVDNMSVADDLRPGLLADLLGATPAVRDFLKPEGSTQADAVFHLTEGLLVATA